MTFLKDIHIYTPFLVLPLLSNSNSSSTSSKSCYCETRRNWKIFPVWHPLLLLARSSCNKNAIFYPCIIMSGTFLLRSPSTPLTPAASFTFSRSKFSLSQQPFSFNSTSPFLCLAHTKRSLLHSSFSSPNKIFLTSTGNVYLFSYPQLLSLCFTFTFPSSSSLPMEPLVLASKILALALPVHYFTARRGVEVAGRESVELSELE